MTWSELKDLYENSEANQDWRARLAAVAGIYLVLATTTGEQYVGSAYGAEGIWGRWADYARDRHGDNVLLKQLVARNRAYPEAFLYSILQILPRTSPRDEVLQWEHHYKNKLGSKANGLNIN
ncbi:MAG: GIY-YIG nuclease family protein [Dehalococcoidia bacterium]|nr:GIY-YIG nuclease family protein [Dehalococcoidia bacterium]